MTQLLLAHHIVPNPWKSLHTEIQLSLNIHRGFVPGPPSDTQIMDIQVLYIKCCDIHNVHCHFYAIYLCQPCMSYNNQCHVMLFKQLCLIVKRKMRRKITLGKASRGSSVFRELNPWIWSLQILQANHITQRGHYKTKSLRIYTVLLGDNAVAGRYRVCRQSPTRQPSLLAIEHQYPHCMLTLTRSYKDSQKNNTEGCSSHRVYFSELPIPVL